MLITKMSETKEIIDKTFQKANIELHPSIVQFLTALEALDDNTALLPLIAPVNHNKVNESKMVQIIHTLMGDSCHGDKNRESQPEDMIWVMMHVSCLHIMQRLVLTIYNKIFQIGIICFIF
jgi:hypothetical protein